MTLQVVAVTRNRSMYVKTLHTLLALQALCRHFKLQIGLNFINDANKDKMELLKKLLKTGDRLVWLDYGVSVQREAMEIMLTQYQNYDGVVFPVANEGIDWNSFKSKTLADSQEPAHQRGLTFDTTVKSVSFDEKYDLYPVIKTDPHIWCIDTKSVTKRLKDKKNGLVLPPTLTKFFENCMTKNVRLMAATGMETFSHFTHECIGNLMNMPGLKVNAV